jgi:hypothetical protein
MGQSGEPRPKATIDQAPVIVVHQPMADANKTPSRPGYESTRIDIYEVIRR